MNFDMGLVEIILTGVMAVFGYLWKVQASGLKETVEELQQLKVDFASMKGQADANNRTLFADIKGLKESMARVEQHLMGGGHDVG